jgi:DNA-binding transcriptional regulator YdaS (Cro superfamily)
METQDHHSILHELSTWCAAKYGRKSKLARMLCVSPQLVNDWFAGKSTPTWDTGLKIQAFLAKSDKARQQAIGEQGS